MGPAVDGDRRDVARGVEAMGAERAGEQVARFIFEAGEVGASSCARPARLWSCSGRPGWWGMWVR
jgi:hypothetical protein